MDDIDADTALKSLTKLSDLEEKRGMLLEVLAMLLLKESLPVFVVNGNSIFSDIIESFKDGKFYKKDYSCGCRMNDIFFDPKEYHIS